VDFHSGRVMEQGFSFASDRVSRAPSTLVQWGVERVSS
jgi:hypothetical protein